MSSGYHPMSRIVGAVMYRWTPRGSSQSRTLSLSKTVTCVTSESRAMSGQCPWPGRRLRLARSATRVDSSVAHRAEHADTHASKYHPLITIRHAVRSVPLVIIRHAVRSVPLVIIRHAVRSVPLITIRHAVRSVPLITIRHAVRSAPLITIRHAVWSVALSHSDIGCAAGGRYSRGSYVARSDHSLPWGIAQLSDTFGWNSH